MPIIAKSSGPDFDRELPPATLHRAVCIDAVYLGWEESAFKNEDGSTKEQEKARIVWELDPETAGIHPHFDNPYRISNKYTLSLHDKANLTRDLVAWRGRTFTDKEKEGFDIEKLIGASCYMNVVHSEDGQWANLGSIMPLPADKKKLEPSGGYVRIKDRPAKDTEPQRENPPADSYSGGGASFGPGDDLPF